MFAMFVNLFIEKNPGNKPVVYFNGILSRLKTDV